jgi:hypothetical protein
VTNPFVPLPLDTEKAVLYGQCVLAAYTMFDAKNADPMKPEPLGIPAGYELGAWIQMSDFILLEEIPKFYGVVVFETANPDSRIIAIRGTEGAVEWVDDGAAIPAPFRQVPGAGHVAQGFDKIYSTLKVAETYSGSFAEQLEHLALSREAERGVAPRTGGGVASEIGEVRRHRPTVVTGHSLGSALSTLFVMENADKKKFDITTSCTFASPKVGTKAFVQAFDALPITSWRIVNTADIVPKLPLTLEPFCDYQHVNVASSFDGTQFSKKDLSCAHSMYTYLHWLDASIALLATCTLAAAPATP